MDFKVRQTGCDHLDVGAEVIDLSTAGLLQVIVGPTQQELLRGQFHQIFQTLAISQQSNQSYTHIHTNTYTLRCHTDHSKFS